MRRIAISVSMLILAGCAPYLEAGVGYSFDNGDYYDIHNEGAVGVVALGLQGEVWKCEYRHRSLLDKRPEVATDDVVCLRRWYVR